MLFLAIVYWNVLPALWGEESLSISTVLEIGIPFLIGLVLPFFAIINVRKDDRFIRLTNIYGIPLRFENSLVTERVLSRNFGGIKSLFIARILKVKIPFVLCPINP